jgi:hypothetical protein
MLCVFPTQRPSPETIGDDSGRQAMHECFLDGTRFIRAHAEMCTLQAQNLARSLTAFSRAVRDALFTAAPCRLELGLRRVSARDSRGKRAIWLVYPILDPLYGSLMMVPSLAAVQHHNAREACQGPAAADFVLGYPNEALRNESIVNAVLPVREGVPRFIHLRLEESAAPLFPGIAALAPDLFFNGFRGVRAPTMDGFLSSSVFSLERRSWLALGVCLRC